MKIAESHVDRSIDNQGAFLNTNLIGTQVMTDACHRYGIRRCHQSSANGVYGDLPPDHAD